MKIFVIYLNNFSNTSDINIENGDEDNESKLTGVKSLCEKATKILSCVFCNNYNYISSV